MKGYNYILSGCRAFKTMNPIIGVLNSNLGFQKFSFHGTLRSVINYLIKIWFKVYQNILFPKFCNFRIELKAISFIGISTQIQIRVRCCDNNSDQLLDQYWWLYLHFNTIHFLISTNRWTNLGSLINISARSTSSFQQIAGPI
jgi:hypothetical protein